MSTTKALQNYTYYSRYAGYNQEKKRRETWSEAVDRMMDMHLGKYPEATDEIEWIRPLIKEKRFLGSQRALQFGGKAILKKHARLYNCSFSYVDRIRFFQEAFWMLLCGSGVGYSVQKHHVEKLPNFTTNWKKQTKVYTIPDTIEGWADSLGILLACYFPSEEFPEWEGYRVEFDYSLIRPQGAYLSSGVGKAPGPEPLKAALERIEKLLNRCVETQEQLRPIDAHDIILHASDAVLSGGVRRSSCISMFSPDDEEMAKCKTGNWMYDNPQRARANNSAVLLRNKTNFKDFCDLVENVKEYGEPGFIWVDDLETGFNPCCEISLYAYDDDGNSGWQVCNLCEINGKKIKCKEDFALAARGAAILGTLQAGYTDFDYLGETSEKIIRREALLGVSITGMMDNPDIIFDPDIQKEMAKLIVKTNEWMAKRIGINAAARCTAIKPAGCRPGDALVTTDKGILTLHEIMEDHDVRTQWDTPKNDYTTAGGPVTKTFINGISDTVKIKLKYGIELICTPNHPWFVKYKIDRAVKGHKTDVNTWVQAQDLSHGDVLDINLNSYTSTSHSKLQKEHRLKAFDKHLYNCNDIKQPDFLNEDLSWLLGYLWGDGTMKISKYMLSFIDQHKNHLEKVQRIVSDHFGISSDIKKCKNKNAYELQFGNKFLWFWLIRNGIYKYDANGIAAIPRIIRTSSHSDIIAFIAGVIDSDGCVRTSCMKDVKRYTAIITTANDEFANHLQHVAMSVGLLFSKSLCQNGKNMQKQKHIWLLDLSAHVDKTQFGILSQHSEKIKSLEGGYLWKHEVDSTRGIMGKVHSVEQHEEIMTYDVETNENWFYAGAIKSHNTTSCILGTASGIHPHHARRYFRRVQGNSMETVLQYFKEHNSICVEKSVWSANDTDEVITFLMEVPTGAITKNQLSALELLERVKLTQQNWIKYGKVESRCVKKWLSHNVSNTIQIMPNEWQEVAKYLFDNRQWFAGVSLIPASGDLDYPQAPFVTVHTAREILQEYGEGAIFASGLIVDGLHAFDNNLWKACDAVLGLGKSLEVEPSNGHHDAWKAKRDWIRRVKQFAERYCEGNVKRACYLMKEVNNWKLWLDIAREYNEVPYEEFFEEDNNTTLTETISCAGGLCSVHI